MACETSVRTIGRSAARPRAGMGFVDNDRLMT